MNNPTLTELHWEEKDDGYVFSPVQEGFVFFVEERPARYLLLASDNGEFFPYEAHFHSRKGKVVIDKNDRILMEFVRQEDLRLW